MAGIQDWPRRVRELRVQFGWKILSGLTVAEIVAEQIVEGDDDPLELPKMSPEDYILVDTVQDKEAATRWKQANSIRQGKQGVLKKIEKLLRLNVGKQLTGEELRYVAGGKTEWARRTRELRTEHGWQVTTRFSGRPDLPVGVYVLQSEQQAPEHDRHIKEPVRRKVLQRDNYTCRVCNWSQALWVSSDARHLEVHHVEHHVHGGSNLEENLKTLCNVCHDEEHQQNPGRRQAAKPKRT